VLLLLVVVVVVVVVVVLSWLAIPAHPPKIHLPWRLSSGCSPVSAGCPPLAPSQYPNEEEVLFPPLTALEVTGTRVDGAVVVVQLRASMKEPGCVHRIPTRNPRSPAFIVL
jgi:hypothetical protein